MYDILMVEVFTYLVHYNHGLVHILCKSEVLSWCWIDKSDVKHMCDLNDEKWLWFKATCFTI